jgi:hypothetical protein
VTFLIAVYQGLQMHCLSDFISSILISGLEDEGISVLTKDWLPLIGRSFISDKINTQYGARRELRSQNDFIGLPAGT